MTDVEMKSLFEGSASPSAETVERLAAESKHHFDAATEAVTHEIRLLAQAVAQLDETVGRKFGALRDGLDRGFAETQAMIRAIHERSSS